MSISLLRWILLGLGLLLLLALWLGVRRDRQAADVPPVKRPPAPPQEPTLGDLPEVAADDAAGELGAPATEPPIMAPIDPPIVLEAAEDIEQASISEWPPPEERVICSLRIVPGAGEKLAGRTLRLGLQAAGFAHGPLGIYHLAGRPDRAMLSAANLAQPGEFDPARMDQQRFSGVHVFTVLPGRLSTGPALEQLYTVAQELARRLSADIQDDTGQPLAAEQLDDWIARYVNA